MSSFDAIFKSVGIDPAYLPALVNEHRLLTADKQRVPANHFPVEDLACAIEQLAGRLADASDVVADEKEDFYVGGICSAVFDIVEGHDGKDEVQIVRDHLGLGNADINGNPPILASTPLFGHRHLRCVTHTILNLDDETFERSSYLVDVRTGEITPVPKGRTPAQAAELLTPAKESSDA